MSSTDNSGVITPVSEEDKAEILAGVTSEMAYWRAAPERFFKAWKEAVALAGVSYFGAGTKAAYAAATDKNQLAPNYELVKEALGYLSGGERTFLVALYSFYNDRAAATLWEEAFKSPDNIGATISGLDLQRRRALAELTVTHTGW